MTVLCASRCLRRNILFPLCPIPLGYDTGTTGRTGAFLFIVFFYCFPHFPFTDSLPHPPVLTPMSSISISSYSFIELSGVSLATDFAKVPRPSLHFGVLVFYLLSFFALYCIIFRLLLFVIVLVSMLPDLLPVHSPSISFYLPVSYISLLYLSLYCK